MSNNPAWTVRAISVPGPDTDLALFVSFDDARFLFGAAEGTQRAFAQKKQGLRGLQGIFVGGGARARGGLAGILMTIADVGIKRVALAGGSDLTHYLATLRGSVVRDQLSVEPHVFSRSSSEEAQVLFSSPRMTVLGVALRTAGPEMPSIGSPARPSQLPPAELDQWTSAIVQDMFRGEGSKPTRNAAQRWHNMVRPSYPDDRYPLPLAESEVATDMVYICRTPDVRGKFDVATAAKLKVPNGPIRSKLVRGESIDVDDPEAPGGKRTVRPEDCIFGGGPGSILMVINCRLENLPKLLASAAFESYRSDLDTPEHAVHCIVHRVSRDVWDNPTYQQWTRGFGSKTQHLYADDIGTGEIFFNSAAWNAFKLNMLDSTIFPVLEHYNPDYSAPSLPENTSLLVPNTMISMYPPKPAEVLERLEKDQQFPTDPSALEALRQRMRDESPEYAAAADAAQASVAEEAIKRVNVQAVPGDDIVVTTLGTGSAIPSKYRNVSSTHLAIPDVGGILLDCGEGTLGQMRRRWSGNMKEIYTDLRMIFISHMHADHHLGLTAILQDRFKYGIHTPLYLVAPNSIALQLQETASWQAGVPQEALENVRFLNVNRLKRAWRPQRQTPPPPSDAMQTEEGAEGAAGPPSSPSRSDGGTQAACQMVEDAAPEDVASGVRKWPFQNVARFHPDCNQRARNTIFSLLSDLGLYEIIAPQVAHRGAAWGLVLSHRSGWKVAYSGDTKPCETFIEAAQNSTILIHEATLEDEKPDVAEAKGHSTFGQAISVGKAMNARYIILNHFSQRYPKIPKLPVATDKEDAAVAISFDFMTLRAGDTWKVAHYAKALEILYAELEVDDDAEENEANGEHEGAKKGKQAKQAKQAKPPGGTKRGSTSSPRPETKKPRGG